MGKALLIAGGANQLDTLDEFNLFGYDNEVSAETNTQFSATEAATFSNLRGNIISGGSGTNNFQFRTGGANGNQLGTRAGPGTFEDAVNTDVLAAADLFNIAYTDTGSASVCSSVVGTVSFSSGHGNFHGACNDYNAGLIYDVESATRFLPISGNLIADGTATEANVGYLNRAYTSWEALQVRVVANSRTNDSVFANRINLADGTGVVTFGAGVTGLVVDTTIGDAIAATDELDISLTLLTGVENLEVIFVGATLKASSGTKSETFASGGGTGVARTASATAHYMPIGGILPSLIAFTEAQARIKPGFAGTASNLRCYLSANTYSVNGTLKLFLNGVEALTTTITLLGGAGWYENTADTVAFDDNDELSFEFVGGTTGSITIEMVGVTLQDDTAGAAGVAGHGLLLSHKRNRLVQVAA